MVEKVLDRYRRPFSHESSDSTHRRGKLKTSLRNWLLKTSLEGEYTMVSRRISAARTFVKRESTTTASQELVQKALSGQTSVCDAKRTLDVCWVGH